MDTNFKCNRRSWLVGGMTAVACLSLNVSAFAQVVGVNDAINKAGRQRMLSQRMTKAWLATGQGVDPSRAERIMSESMSLFDRQLVELKAYAPNSEIKATYANLDAVWSDYKAILVGHAPEKSAAIDLLALDANVLKLSHQGTIQMERYSGQSVGRLVNLAGRQRMLSQRTAKFYLSKSWGVSVPDQLKELDAARREFVQALQVLKDAPEATDVIRQELELAQQQWVFFDNALANAKEASSATQHAKEVFTASENILKVMDRVTSLYSKLT